MDSSFEWICTSASTEKCSDPTRCHSIDELDSEDYIYEDVIIKNGTGNNVSAGSPDDVIHDAEAPTNDVTSVSEHESGTCTDISDGKWFMPPKDNSQREGRLKKSDKEPPKKMAPQVLPKPLLPPGKLKSRGSSLDPSINARGSVPSLTSSMGHRAKARSLSLETSSLATSKKKPDIPVKPSSLSSIIPFRVPAAKVKEKGTTGGREILAAMKRQSLIISDSSGEDEAETESVYSEQVFYDWSDSDEESKRETGVREESLYSNVDRSISAPKNKAHRIALEILTTEQAYVKKLEILQQARRETSSVLGDAVANDMFPAIDSICKLHKENMLPRLTERLTLWESSQRIGDVMKTFAPFLKLYTDYVKNYSQALQLIEQWNGKSKEFQAIINALPSIAKGPAANPKLQIRSHMLEPIQRVPRYELLLRQYLKHIAEDSPDFADVTAALQTVAASARHFEECMKQGSVMIELIELQQLIDSPYSIISPGRCLIKQGKLLKVNATTGKVVPHYGFLFNDLFVLCTEQAFRIPGVTPKYKAKKMLSIDRMQISDGESYDNSYAFYLKTEQLVLEMCASTEDETSDWQKLFWQTIGDRLTKRISRAYSLHPEITVMTARQEDLGKQAPVWIHNSQVSMCQMCALEFKGLRKKHHCRACGKVVCYKCSSHTTRLEYDKARERRVCDECFFLLTHQNSQRGSAAKKESHFQARARALCVYSGFLHISMDEGKSWQKQWSEIHEGGIFFSFKAQQDICPVFSLVLEGCSAMICRLNRETEPRTIRLSDRDKIYYLKEETADKASKWMDHMNGVNRR